MPVIKRYSNRKLYDTDAGQYVTLEDVARFIRQGEDVHVVDHQTGRDLTSLTLMQVLFQEERKIGELLPEMVLTRLIRMGDETVTDLRERVFAAVDPQGQAESEIRRRVDALVARGELAAGEAQQWLEKLISPAGQWDVSHRNEPPPAPAATESTTDVQDLVEQLDRLEQELAELKARPGK